MRFFVPATALVLFGLLVGAPNAGEKKGGPKKEQPPTSAWAQVTIGGEIRDLIELRGKVNVQVLLDAEEQLRLPANWDGPPAERLPEVHVRSMQVGDASWVVTMLDAADPDLGKVLPKLRPPEKGGLRVFVKGRLAAAKDRDPFVAHAKAWGTMRVAADGPTALGMGDIMIVGEVLPGKHAIGKGQFTSLAIRNGSSPILVTGKVVEEANQPKGMVHVVGKLTVSKQGPLVVDARSISEKIPK
jgi:hypothetical protein